MKLHFIALLFCTINLNWRNPQTYEVWCCNLAISFHFLTPEEKQTDFFSNPNLHFAIEYATLRIKTKQHKELLTLKTRFMTWDLVFSLPLFCLKNFERDIYDKLWEKTPNFQRRLKKYFSKSRTLLKLLIYEAKGLFLFQF